MQSGQLTNCIRCGRLFLKDHSDSCLDCYLEIEHDFKCVAEFLEIDQNRYATIEQVSEGTNVSVKQISEFLRDGLIFSEDYPNLGYGCSHCGKLIKRQLLCNECFVQFSTDVSRTLTKEKLLEEIQSK
ncbi:flagellar protein [Paenisporosarcina sp.]|uniref:flagellar protein n=1 Tax=Paenisporosarcina sp. TaxID=1932001 RepID=UPI003C7728F3